MQKSNYILLILSLMIFLIIGCKKNTTSSSNIGVEWSSRVDYKHNYRNGIYIGKTCSINFTIIDGSGELIITAEMTQGNGNKESTSCDVVEDETYTLKFPFTETGDAGCNTGAIVAKMEINAGYTSPRIINYYCYSSSCPSKWTIGELIVE